MRALGLTNDVLHDGLPVGRLLEVLLASHPTNQMAFEYVMADYLLNLDLKAAVQHLRLLDNFNYTQIPRPYEEALLLFQELAGVKVELKGRTIHSETAERFREFKAAASEWGDKANARRPSPPGSGTPIGFIMPLEATRDPSKTKPQRHDAASLETSLACSLSTLHLVAGGRRRPGGLP